MFAGIVIVAVLGSLMALLMALQAALASVLIVSGTFNQIISYFVFITVLFVGLTVAGLFVLRRRDVAEAAYRTPGYPLTPAIFLVLVAVMLVLLAGHNPSQAALGAGDVGLGVPVYFLAVRRRLTQHGTARNDLDSDDPPFGSG